MSIMFEISINEFYNHSKIYTCFIDISFIIAEHIQQVGESISNGLKEPTLGLEGN